METEITQTIPLIMPLGTPLYIHSVSWQVGIIYVQMYMYIIHFIIFKLLQNCDIQVHLVQDCLKTGSYFTRKWMQSEFDVLRFAANDSRKLKCVKLLRTSPRVFAVNHCRRHEFRFRVKYEPAFTHPLEWRLQDLQSLTQCACDWLKKVNLLFISFHL